MSYVHSIFNMTIPFRDRSILYNTYTGALIILEKPLNEYTNYSEHKQLVEQGFLVDERFNETNKLIMERNRELYTLRSKVLNIEIAPTMKCQAKCWYCFENKYSVKNAMSDKVAADTIVFIKQRIMLAKCDTLSLLFFGGEPLLADKQIIAIGREIKAYCQELNITFHSEIITNGISFSVDLAKELKDFIQLKQVQITLDGLGDSHDKVKGIACFDSVVEHITAAAELVNISIRLNVSNNNKDEIPHLVKYLLEDKELDGKVRIYLARVDDLDSCESANGTGYMDNFFFVDYRNDFIRKAIKKYKSFRLTDLLPDVKRNYCGYERASQVMIGSGGELYRCQRTLGDATKVIGDIYLGEYYTNNEMNYFRPIDEKCKEGCNLLPVCFGGCPNERVKGKPVSYCELRKYQIEQDIITFVDFKING